MNTTEEKPPKNPNPQGKGLVPVLQDWASLQTGALDPKSPAAFLRDYCISSFILSASFRFKPVINRTYYIYARENDWTLSLIGPGEWQQNRPGIFLAGCHLRPDMTWELETDSLQGDPEALERVQSYIREFVTGLTEQESITDTLPYYVRELPYYQRMLMSALSASLKQSLPPTGDDMKALLGEDTLSKLLPG